MPIPRKWVSLKRQIFEFEGQPKEFGQLDGSVNKVTNLINGHLIDFKNIIVQFLSNYVCINSNQFNM